MRPPRSSLRWTADNRDDNSGFHTLVARAADFGPRESAVSWSTSAAGFQIIVSCVSAPRYRNLSGLNVALHRIEQRLMPITVLLADDSDLLRRAIRRLLSSHPVINLVGEATVFTQTIRMIQELQPQIVILDLHMSDSKRITPGEFRSRLNLGKARLMAISVWNDPETQALADSCLLYTSPSPRDLSTSRMPSSA